MYDPTLNAYEVSSLEDFSDTDFEDLVSRAEAGELITLTQNGEALAIIVPYTKYVLLKEELKGPEKS